MKLSVMKSVAQFYGSHTWYTYHSSVYYHKHYGTTNL